MLAKAHFCGWQSRAALAQAVCRPAPARQTPARCSKPLAGQGGLIQVSILLYRAPARAHWRAPILHLRAHRAPPVAVIGEQIAETLMLNSWGKVLRRSCGGPDNPARQITRSTQSAWLPRRLAGLRLPPQQRRSMVIHQIHHLVGEDQPVFQLGVAVRSAPAAAGL